MHKIFYIFITITILGCSADTENCLNFYKNATQWVLPRPNLDSSCLE